MDSIEILFNGVKSQLCCEDEEELMTTLEDVLTNGASVGWPGFTYYVDTVEFYRKYEEEIWDLLDEQYDTSGLYGNIIEFIGSFNGAKDVGNLTQFKNLLAWYALEEVARYKIEDED